MDQHDLLQRVVETYKLCRDPQGNIRDLAAGDESPVFSADTPVSMNFWGLTPWFFTAAEERFAAFLRDPGRDPLKSECLLPSMIDTLMREEGLPVRVLHTHDKWFGVTYREDKPLVQAALAEKHRAGEYPDVL